MSLVFIEPFDEFVDPALAAHFAPSTPPRWDGVFGSGQGFWKGGNALFGRCGSAGFFINSGSTPSDGMGIMKNIPIYPTYFMGVSVNMASLGGNISHLPIFGLTDGLIAQVAVCLNANGTLELRTGYGATGGTDLSTLLGTTTYQLPFTDFHFIELKVVANTSTGSAILRVDNVVVLTLTNINTAMSTGNNQISGVGLGKFFTGGGNSNSSVYYDDLYVLDDTGLNSWSKTFLGDTRQRMMMPSGNGSRTQWTAVGAASQWQCVNEVTPLGGDGDTTYISDATPGDVQYFTFPAVPTVNNTVFALAALIELRKDDGAARTVNARLRSPASTGTEVSGPNPITVPSSYGYLQEFFETDPATTAQWLSAAVNAAELGVIDVA